MVGGLPGDSAIKIDPVPADKRSVFFNFTEQPCFLDECGELSFICVHSFECGDEIADASKVSIHRGKTHISNFTKTLEMTKHQLTNF
jgi:hypothetical protein